MNESGPDVESSPSRPSNEGRLESWKEIAAYLNRDVSTVRRWEKREGLPVHRHLHDKLGTVYAYRSELDAWLASRGPRVSEVTDRASRWKWLLVGAAATAVLALAVLFFQPSPQPPVPTPTSRPSIAVLYFDNLSEDTSLDWLREGLTDMLVTDLSQSPHLEVLGTDRLFQILSDMDRLEEPITSSEVVQEVARRAGAGTVVLGSFMKSGESYRIDVRVQDASSGKILASEKIEGSGDSSVFPMVDELTRRIKTTFEIPLSADVTGFDRGIEEVTTSSFEAYRYHIEGRRLHLHFRHEEAIALYEKAVAADPGFALALNGLAEAHGMLGHTREKSEYYRRALDHADRLPARERYYVEGSYYCQWEDTYDRSIEALEKLVELYPDHNTGRLVLAWLYGLCELYDEAMEHGVELRRRGYARPPAGLAAGYARKGDFDKGYDLLQEFVTKNPENAVGHHRLGGYFAQWGKLDEALEAFNKAQALRPFLHVVHWSKLNLCLLQENWEQAEAAVKQLHALKAPVWEFWGTLGLTVIRFYNGKSDEGLATLEQAIRNHKEPDRLRAGMRNFAAYCLLEKSEALPALEHAGAAQQEGNRNSPEWEGLFLAALAQVKLGRREQALDIAESLRAKTEPIPSQKEKRRYHHLLGDMAFDRGDTTRAIEELERAQSMLPARGLYPPSPFPRLPQHVPIWYSLATAYSSAGKDDQAAVWFERIIESTTERIYWPIPYVRSFYFLGKIHENRGEMEEARECYRRFYEYWKNGDMDRERVEEAKSKL